MHAHIWCRRAFLLLDRLQKLHAARAGKRRWHTMSIERYRVSSASSRQLNASESLSLLDVQPSYFHCRNRGANPTQCGAGANLKVKQTSSLSRMSQVVIKVLKGIKCVSCRRDETLYDLHKPLGHFSTLHRALFESDGRTEAASHCQIGPTSDINSISPTKSKRPQSGYWND